MSEGTANYKFHKPKTVALDLQPLCWQRSGIGNVAYELSRRMQSSEDIKFYGTVFNFMGRNDNSGHLKGIPYQIRECRLIPYGIYRRIWGWAPITFDGIFGNADLSVFFNYAIPKKLNGKSFVFIYDLTYLRYPETMSKQNLGFISESTAYSTAHATHLLTDSEFIKGEICSCLQVPESKVDVIYPSISVSGALAELAGDPQAISAYHEQKDLLYQELCTRYGIGDAPYLLFVSTIEPRKNIARMLRAYAYLKEKYHIPHKLILAGGKGWNNEEIYQTAEELSCRTDIVFTGFVSSDEKNSLYLNADAFVFPSIYEGFGIPPLEAMSFGCPVIAANAASIPEACGCAAELVDPFDETSIAEGIHRVICDREFRAQLIAKGYCQCKAFSWEKSATKLYECCKQVLDL